jgi:hypothetical protein
VSTIVKFFRASPPEAVEALRHGPNPSLRTISLGNFDAEEALMSWESELTGTSFDDLLDTDVPEIVASENDSFVFQLSDPLLRELATISDSRAEELGRWWATEANDGRNAIEPRTAAGIIREVAHLSREPRSAGESIYCWMA